jgi:RIO-like serine/threonine protein kinase
MSYEHQILQAMLRLARKREGVTVEALDDRVEGTVEEARSAVRLLERAGLVERRGASGARLTFAGFALAVAKVDPAPPRARAARSRAA